MAQPKRYDAVPASPRNLIATELAGDVMRPIAGLMFRPRFAMEVRGFDTLPKKEPYLLLSNHVGFHDPFQLILAAKRVVHFLTTQATMTDPVLGRVMQAFGAIPKQKGVADPKAIRGLQEWVKVGGAVGLFPEGERSWTGAPLPILPGIERLARVLRVPVVTARIENADFLTPRWAEHARRSKVRITFDSPWEIDRKAKRTEIRDALIERLSIDPANCWRAPVRGRRFARGITNILYRCPSCAAIESLVEGDDDLSCRRCGDTWDVGPDNHLENPKERRPIWELVPQMQAALAETYDAQLEQSGSQPEDPSSILVRSLEPVEMFQVDAPEAGRVRGDLVVSVDEVRIERGGERVWRIPLQEVGAMTVEMRRRLQVIASGGKLYEFDVPRESVLKFKFAVDHLKSRAGA